MRREHRKLIRDRIPEILDQKGVQYEVVELTDEQYEAALRAKVIEEAHEVQNADQRSALAEEIADLYEVLVTLMASSGLTEGEVRELQTSRRADRGGFERKLELLWTETEA